MTFNPAGSFPQNAGSAAERKRELGEFASNFQYESGSPRQLSDGVRKAGSRLADYVKEAIESGRTFGAVAGRDRQDKKGFDYGQNWLNDINNGPLGYLAEDSSKKDKTSKNATDGEFDA